MSCIIYWIFEGGSYIFHVVLPIRWMQDYTFHLPVAESGCSYEGEQVILVPYDRFRDDRDGLDVVALADLHRFLERQEGILLLVVEIEGDEEIRQARVDDGMHVEQPLAKEDAIVAKDVPQARVPVFYPFRERRELPIHTTL